MFLKRPVILHLAQRFLEILKPILFVHMFPCTPHWT